MEKDFSYDSRKENTRSIDSHPVISFELSEIKEHFSDTLSAINRRYRTANYYRLIGCDRDANYIWQSQIVFLESAFDFFMHEMTKYGLCKIFDGCWHETEKYRHIMVDLETTTKALSNPEDVKWFLEYINQYYRKDTFTSYESVKDQLNLLGLNMQAVADTAFYQREATEKTIDKMKRRLNELYSRRNIIAHQSNRWHEDAVEHSIDETIVRNFVDDIKKIVDAICDECKNK